MLSKKCIDTKKKIIIIIYRTLEEFEYEKYGGKIFEKYFDVEVWNIEAFFWDKKLSIPKQIYRSKNIKNIINYRDFIQNLNDCNRKKVFMSLLLPPGLRKTYYIQAIISCMGFRYSMSFCQPYLCTGNVGKLKDDFKLKNKDRMNELLNHLFPPMFNFVATTANYREFPSVRSIKKQNNILIHTLDYDNYLKIKTENKRIIQDKFIVFIDECYIGHSDYEKFNIKTPFHTPDKYYVPLNRFFEKVEHLFGYRIVIAEHPRGEYPDSSMFGNREMIQGQTARLIRDAELVLCHTSTAIDYVILFKKKYILFYMDEIKRFYEWKEFYSPLLKYLDINALNVSKNYTNEEIEEIISDGSSLACEKYKNRFIKKRGTKEELFFEIEAEYILKFFEKFECRGN